MKPIPLELAREALAVDRSSPSGLRWKLRTAQSTRVGDRAGYLCQNGYWYVSLGGQKYLAHRLIYAMLNDGVGEGLLVDHRNGDTCDPSPNNLRPVTRALNQRNQRIRKANTSGVCGVFMVPKQNLWVATWRDLEGGQHRKTFGLRKHGDKAFDLAVQARTAAIAALNQQGAGYTARHGT